jgi:hypothetical protein
MRIDEQRAEYIKNRALYTALLTCRAPQELPVKRFSLLIRAAGFFIGVVCDLLFFRLEIVQPTSQTDNVAL